MTKPAAFAATYADWKLIRTRKCVQVVFEVPLEAANEAHAALGGMPNPAAEAWFAIARLDVSKVQQTEEVMPNTEDTRSSGSNNTQPASVHPPGRAPATLAQIAGMNCHSRLFQQFLNTRMPLGFGPVIESTRAADAVRELCKVKSRSEIKVGTDAGERFELLYREFLDWKLADAYVEAS